MKILKILKKSSLLILCVVFCTYKDYQVKKLKDKLLNIMLINSIYAKGSLPFRLPNWRLKLFDAILILVCKTFAVNI